jgi:hypothetical protein
MASAHLITVSGIYAIQHIPTGREYIGGSVDIRRRWQAHGSLLRRGIHWCPLFQQAWDQDGEAGFTYLILALTDAQHLRGLEQRYLDARRPVFNRTLDAESGTKQRTYLRPLVAWLAAHPWVEEAPYQEDRGTAADIAARQRAIIRLLDNENERDF